MPVVYDFGSTQFDDAVRAATREAFAETLGAGLPVFYIDGNGLNVMERAERSGLSETGAPRSLDRPGRLCAGSACDRMAG